MKMSRRGERGFTLIELLIVVAILGVLAAVVIPNVGRFLGRGEAEARRTEFHNVSSAVIAMMVDNNLAAIPNPISAAANATNIMDQYPDITAAAATGKLKDTAGTSYTFPGDKIGFLLYQHDNTADASAVIGLVNYVNMQRTKYYYTVDADGTAHQYNAAGGTEYTY